MNVRVVVAVAALVALAGCLGPIASYASDPAAVDGDAAEAEGYALLASSQVPVVVPLYLGPIGGDVRITGHLTVYGVAPDLDAANASGAPGRADDGDPTVDAGSGDALLFVLSTPDADLLGQSVNPFAHLSNQDLLVAAIDAVSTLNTDFGVGSVANLQVDSTADGRVLGTTTDVVTYDGTVVDEAGNATAVRLYLATVQHEDDVVVLVALHGVDADEGSRESLLRLMNAVEHPVPRAELGPGLFEQFENATRFEDPGAFGNVTTPAA